MKSNKQKKCLLGEKRQKKKLDTLSDSMASGLKNGSIQPVDKVKVFSKIVLPLIPDYYRDKAFVCIDCDRHQLWTAKQQKWWYEEANGEIETTAIRCRECRNKEQQRKEQASKVHLEGLKNKKT